MERPRSSRKTLSAGIHRLAPALMLLLPLVCAGALARAAEVFKSVDAEGHVVYSDHAGPDSQRVQLEDDSATPPRVMHVCWTNCFTLELDGGLYRRADGTDETWTIDRFTSDSFLLHRHDAPASWNGFSADVAYEGQTAGERLVSVMVGGRPVNDIQAAWGAALESLPGSNAERDQGNAAPLPDAEVRTAAAPPPLQDDAQPPCPDDGYLWTPAYWAWGGGGYYWVPGVWVRPPRAGILWTPGYWSFGGAAYVFHPGYWGPHVGYYGGINYGFGYAGVGFTGGRWAGNAFSYNRSVNNLDSRIIRNTYNEPPAANNVISKVSYNGGPGGVIAAPTSEERAAASEAHIPATPQQHRYVQSAGTPTLVAMQGHPAVVDARKPVASTTPRETTHHSSAQPAAPTVSRAATVRTVAHEASEPTPRAKVAAARPAAPKSGSATSMSSPHPAH